MPRRKTDVALLSCALTGAERVAASDLRGLLGLPSDAELVRAGLRALAESCDLLIDEPIFAPRPRARIPNPESRTGDSDAPLQDYRDAH